MMSIAYISRYECALCGKYHKNGSKAMLACEKAMKEELPNGHLLKEQQK